MRIVGTLILVLLAAALSLAGYGYWNARADPVVRRANIQLQNWSAGARPVRLLLASDMHLESAAMDGTRLNRIVAQIDALRPDLILLAGDFIEGRDPREPATVALAMIAALRRLHAPLGTVAVLGNHDYWTNARQVGRILQQAGVTLLRNQAVIRGPLVIGGIDDEPTGHQRIRQTLFAMQGLVGAKVLLSHSPEVASFIRKAAAQSRPRILLAGHTHCGQVVLPRIGPPIDVVDPHYRCGIVRDPGLVTIVTAGLGTSDLPLRIGAPPDLWVVTLSPAATPVSRPRS